MPRSDARQLLSVALSGGPTACVYGHDVDRRSLVDRIGASRGTAALPTAPGGWRFDVDAGGAWQIAIGQALPPAKLVRTVPLGARGDHPGVVGLVEVTAAPVPSATHEGERAFLVRALPGAATTVAVDAVSS